MVVFDLVFLDVFDLERWWADELLRVSNIDEKGEAF